MGSAVNGSVGAYKRLYKGYIGDMQNIQFGVCWGLGVRFYSNFELLVKPKAPYNYSAS